MRFLIDTFIKHRDSFALAMFLSGVPIVYYLRDGLGLAPGSSAFAIGLIFSPLLISLTFKDLKYIQKPHQVVFPLITWLLIVLLAYALLRDPALRTYSRNSELLIFGMIGIVASSIIFMKNSAVGHAFIKWIMFFSFIGAVALIFYISQNPFYLIGQRATFGYGEEGIGSNPHINSKGAFFGIVASVLALKHHKTLKLGLIIPLIVLLLCIIVLFLTQTMLAFLATFMFGVVFLFYNGSAKNIANILRTIFTKWYFLVLLIGASITLVVQFNKNKELIDPALNYVEYRIGNLKDSFTPNKERVKVTEVGDASAATRIMHFYSVFERFAENIDEGKYLNALFGNGYKYLYIDIPHLEVLDAFGLLGFLFYTMIFVRIVLMCTREMKNPDHIGTEFLAYIFLYFFIANFTAGQLVEHYRFGTFYILARFLRK